MMDSGDKAREQISALADGELDPGQAKRLLERLHQDGELRAAWDRYHAIGDAIRSEAMAAPMRPDFATRMAARLDAEPPLLAPKRKLLARVGAWPTALAAVAAAGFGFVLAPGLFGGADTPAGGMVQVAGRSPAAQGAVLAEASGLGAVAQAGVADYIRLHQSANPGLYATLPLARPVVLDGSSGR